MEIGMEVFTLERDNKLPLRFMGTLMAEYASDDKKYTLYLTDEFIKSAMFVVNVVSDNFADGKTHQVETFEYEDDARTFLIDKLGPYKSLIFQQQLGYEEVEMLE